MRRESPESNLCLATFTCIFSFFLPCLFSGFGNGSIGSWLFSNMVFIVGILAFVSSCRELRDERKRARSRPRLYE
nr:hypothetical protein [Candidatus Sigynarchaeum springense]